MATAYASTVIDAPADEVWAVVRDFNGLGTWNAKFIPACEIEDGKAGDQVGAVRSFTLANGEHLREQLLAHSDRERFYTYDFLKHPFEGVENYVSTIHVVPVTDTNQAFVEWSVTFEDSHTWAKPWTFAMNLTKVPDEQGPFEYACNEGNYGLHNILTAARAEEAEIKAAAAKGIVKAPSAQDPDEGEK